jgi:hypothetical protein
MGRHSMTTAKVTKNLTAYREVLAASEDSIRLAEIIEWLDVHHPEVDMPARSLLICHMTSMLAATLSVESLVNDILQSVVRDEGGARWEAKWAEFERRPLKEKVVHICESMGFASPLGERPFQIIDEMLDFRARIVHAKPELIEVQFPASKPLNRKAMGHASLVTAWERACTMENAVRFRDAARAIAHWLIVNSGGKYGPDIATVRAIE